MDDRTHPDGYSEPPEPLHVCTDPCGDCSGGCDIGHAPTCPVAGDRLRDAIRALPQDERDALFADLGLYCPEHRMALRITEENDR